MPYKSKLKYPDNYCQKICHELIAEAKGGFPRRVKSPVQWHFLQWPDLDDVRYRYCGKCEMLMYTEKTWICPCCKLHMRHRRPHQWGNV
jgi:hypothetical protein